MLDLSWGEIMVIAVAAIVFIGPKELPKALRVLGQWTAKARAMAREFQTNVDDMVRESELGELRKQAEKLTGGDFEREIEKTVDPKGDIAKAFEAPNLDLPSAPALDAPPVVATEPTVAPPRSAA